MKLTKNQLAMAAYVCVNGSDGNINQTEANALRDMLKVSTEFSSSVDDWNFIISLYSSGKLDYSEVVKSVNKYQLLTKYKICFIICHGINKAGNSWSSFNSFAKNIGVDVDAYNEWISKGGRP